MKSTIAILLLLCATSASAQDIPSQIGQSGSIVGRLQQVGMAVDHAVQAVSVEVVQPWSAAFGDVAEARGLLSLGVGAASLATEGYRGWILFGQLRSFVAADLSFYEPLRGMVGNDVAAVPAESGVFWVGFERFRDDVLSDGLCGIDVQPSLPRNSKGLGMQLVRSHGLPNTRQVAVEGHPRRVVRALDFSVGDLGRFFRIDSEVHEFSHPNGVPLQLRLDPPRARLVVAITAERHQIPQSGSSPVDGALMRPMSIIGRWLSKTSCALSRAGYRPTYQPVVSMTLYEIPSVGWVS